MQGLGGVGRLGSLGILGNLIKEQFELLRESCAFRANM